MNYADIDNAHGGVDDDDDYDDDNGDDDYDDDNDDDDDDDDDGDDDGNSKIPYFVSENKVRIPLALTRIINVIQIENNLVLINLSHKRYKICWVGVLTLPLICWVIRSIFP